ncbi:MAG: DNA/RNA nuclease SfsA [Nitrososphaeria archaeon]
MKICLEIRDKYHYGKIVRRVNRFVVSVLADNDIKACHLHETGRLRELIYPGNEVIYVDRKRSKTSCLIIAARGRKTWVITDSALQRPLALCMLREMGSVKPEVKLLDSRIDFFVEPDTYVETKGCTLAENGVALFPDAPTERGRRHLEDLIKVVKDGKNALIYFLIMRDDVRCFYPNYATDPEFSRLLFEAIRAGVGFRASVFTIRTEERLKVYYVKDVGLCRERPQVKGSDF